LTGRSWTRPLSSLSSSSSSSSSSSLFTFEELSRLDRRIDVLGSTAQTYLWEDYYQPHGYNFLVGASSSSTTTTASTTTTTTTTTTCYCWRTIYATDPQQVPQVPSSDGPLSLSRPDKGRVLQSLIESDYEDYDMLDVPLILVRFRPTVITKYICVYVNDRLEQS
jgi:hypothetical protein